jgi:transglutaminase-like putative cysteine protease
MGKGNAILLGIFIVSVMLFQVAGAADDSLFYTDSLLLDTELSSSLHLSPKTADSEIDYVTTSLYFYPRADDRQEVLSLTTKPEATRAEDFLLFKWDKPTESSLMYSVESQTLTYNRFMPVKTKILFPISNIPQEYLEYTKPTKLIDINPDIVSRATQLAEGETDEYVIVFKAADWVKSNVKYDLNTLTAEAAQPASWVLKNREF